MFAFDVPGFDVVCKICKVFVAFVVMFCDGLRGLSCHGRLSLYRFGLEVPIRFPPSNQHVDCGL